MMLSRVADSFYWIGRYCERAEHACRLMQITLTAGLEAGSTDAGPARGRALAALGADEGIRASDPLAAARALTFGPLDGIGTVADSTFAARENARQIRDQITTEMWERLNRLHFRVRDAAAAPDFAAIAFGFYEEAILDLHAFKGIVEGTLSHGEGFRFLSLGRALERAQLVVALLDLHLGERPGSVGDYGWTQLLRMCCGLEPYLRAKTADFRREHIAHFLALDPHFPRSLRYCAARIDEHAREIAMLAGADARDASLILSGRLKALLDYAALEDVTGRSGQAFTAKVAADCAAISEAVHASFISYSLADRLPGGGRAPSARADTR